MTGPERWPDAPWRGKAAALVGTASCGRSLGADETLRAVERSVRDGGLDCEVVRVGCMGVCSFEPLLTVFRPGTPGVVYDQVLPPMVPRILDAHFGAGEVILNLALGALDDGTAAGVRGLDRIPLFGKQERRVLRHCGLIDPLDISHYLANGGYAGLRRAVELGPDGVISEVKRSGLRGRGGAGFPTGRKWELARQSDPGERYLICNAAEGDVGASMDRMLLESDPQSVIEGMVTAAYACGASVGFVYVRAEYDSVIPVVQAAISQARGAGYLGRGILGTDFDFDISVFAAAGNYVCGEETALINSMEGKRGVPRLRPPFPIQSGLWGRPTVINNVKTLANVPLILRYGADWFSSVGTGKSRGTAVLTLGGSVARAGVVEVPMGMPLREIICDIGGGALAGKRLNAVQTGGPLGGVIPERLLDVRADFESLREIGSPLGSGGIIVIDEDTCMVDVARYFVDFAQRECCGHCALCRLGTTQMREILYDIVAGRAALSDLDLLAQLAEAMRAGSFCAFGQSAPNLVLSTIEHFREEYEDHILRGRCPTGSCLGAGAGTLSGFDPESDRIPNR